MLPFHVRAKFKAKQLNISNIGKLSKLFEERVSDVNLQLNSFWVSQLAGDWIKISRHILGQSDEKV